MRGRPSPAMAVALLALFVALGGSSYAALRIGSKQLVNNSVKSKDIRNRTLIGRDVKNNALAGGQINETGLGTVPSALSAQNAQDAGHANAAGTADNQIVASPKVVSPGPDVGTVAENQAAATPVVLFSHKGLSVYGKCFQDGTGVLAEAYMATSQDRAIAENYNSNWPGGNANQFLNTDTPESDRYIQATSAGPSAASFVGGEQGANFTLIGPDRAYINGTATFGAKNGGLPGGDGPYGPGNACIFAGRAELG